MPCEDSWMQKGHYARYTFDDVTGKSDAITETINILRKMAATESPVLLIERQVLKKS